jgi:osomolarity two-component system sensor histidine kinase SLN1
MSSYTSNGTTQNASTLASSAAPVSEALGSQSLPSATTSSDASKQREYSVSLQSSIGKGLTTLVVEDDRVLRALLQRLLLRLGCEVESAEDGQVALEKLGLSPLQSATQPEVLLPAPSESGDKTINDPPRIALPSRTHFDGMSLD